MLNNKREYGSAALVAIYADYLAASQILAARAVEFDIGIYVFLAQAAVFIYPFIPQAIGMINEVYGLKRARIVIFIAFITQVLLVIFFCHDKIPSHRPPSLPMKRRAGHFHFRHPPHHRVMDFISHYSDD